MENDWLQPHFGLGSRHTDLLLVLDLALHSFMEPDCTSRLASEIIANNIVPNANDHPARASDVPFQKRSFACSVCIILLAALLCARNGGQLGYGFGVRLEAAKRLLSGHHYQQAEW